jgi:hypothetical protein
LTYIIKLHYVWGAHWHIHDSMGLSFCDILVQSKIF